MLFVIMKMKKKPNFEEFPADWESNMYRDNYYMVKKAKYFKRRVDKSYESSN